MNMAPFAQASRPPAQHPAGQAAGPGTFLRPHRPECHAVLASSQPHRRDGSGDALPAIRPHL